jgi:type IV secretory pathway VirB4 component
MPGLFQTGTQSEAEEIYKKGMADILDLIAPSGLIVSPNELKLNEHYIKTLFVYTYPRFVNTNWLSPVITYDTMMDTAMFIYPVESKKAMENLRKQIGRMESAHRIEQEKGLVSDPELETAMQDVEKLRYNLQKGEVKVFEFSLYFTFYSKSKRDLEETTKQIESNLGGRLIFTKPAFMQMEQGFTSTLPLCKDDLLVTRPMDTGSLSTSFPFTSTTLSNNDGVLYGLNRHNNSLVLFDRFQLENANMVAFATSGAGKSYAVKLEALRSLMFGTDIIIIDPEEEYKKLAEAVGGGYLDISLQSDKRINPFDLPKTEGAGEGEAVLRSAIIAVHGLTKMMLESAGEKTAAQTAQPGAFLTPTEDSILEKAIYETYALKDITVDPASHKNPPPTMSDLASVLANMRGGEGMAQRLEKYTAGTFAGLFNQPTNFDLAQGFLVFSIKNLEDQLRPLAMYMILNYIWTQVRSNLRRRIMIVDEAWWMMQYEDSAKFLYALVKRARKYYLGLTVISQDVQDFLSSRYGKAVVSNSALQFLLKQAPSAIDIVAKVFNLTQGEKFMLLESAVGEGLFFAGLNHVALKVIASPIEDKIITSDPKELLAQKAELEKAQPQMPKNEPPASPPQE